MPVAVLSDVHSNLPALEAVLKALDALVEAGEAAVEEVVCLGDVVGYAAQPAECLDLVRDRADLVLRGNHDDAVAGGDAFNFNVTAAAGVRHAQKELDREALDYLDGLEPLARRDGVCYVHASPRDPLREYVFPDATAADLEAVAAAGEADVVVMGHTHVPMDLDVDGVRLVNPGAVGQPRDGDPRASFALLDAEAGTFEVRRVDYDVDAAVQAIETAGLPAFNGERLSEGM